MLYNALTNFSFLIFSCPRKSEIWIGKRVFCTVWPWEEVDGVRTVTEKYTGKILTAS